MENEATWFGPGAIEEYLMQATRATRPIPMCFTGRRREAFFSCGDVDAAAIINNDKVRIELQRDEPGWTWGTVPPSTCLLLLPQRTTCTAMQPPDHDSLGHYVLWKWQLFLSINWTRKSVVTRCSEFNLRPQHACPL
ncbi:unnamed protein product [Musa acuminata subsp. burmannicoides]